MDNNSTQIYDNDEIDLIQIIGTLCQKKWFIIAIAILGLIIASAYAFTAKEKWTSKSEIEPNKIYNNYDYLLLRTKLYSNLTDVDSINNQSNQNFQPKEINNQLYQNFRFQLNIYNNKVNFLKQPEIISLLSNKKLEQLTEVEFDSLIRNFEKVLLINLVTDENEYKNRIKYDEINYSAINPKMAKTILTKYLEYINSITITEDKKEFIDELKLKQNEFRINNKKIAYTLEENKKFVSEKIKQQYNIAEETLPNQNISTDILYANILNNSNKDNSYTDYLFLLGKDKLRSLMNNIEKMPIIYDLNYYSNSKKIEYIQQTLDLLEKESTTKIKAYNFIKSPSYPTVKDAPKRILIMLIGLVLGSIIGCGIVLLKSSFKKINLLTHNINI